MPLDINTIRTLISAGDTDGALNALQVYFQENPSAALGNDFILIKARWAAYLRNFTMGLGVNSNTPNQINYALLSLLDQLGRAAANPQVQPAPNPWETSGTPKFVVVYAVADDPYCKMLNLHLNALKITKKISVYNVHHDLKTGDVVAAARNELANATYILALITVNLFNAPEWFDLLEEQRLAGKRIIPIRLEQVGGYEDTDFAKLRSLPTMNRTVQDFASQDAAFTDIVTEIRKLL